MYSQIDIDGLEKVLEAGRVYEGCNLLKMDKWAQNSPNICGTAGCLIGSFCLLNKEDRLQLDVGIHYSRLSLDGFEYGPVGGEQDYISERFRIPYRVASFLFTNHADHTIYRYKYDNSHDVDAQFLSGADAIIRLEKTIAYLKRKQEMWRECLRVQSLPKKQRRILQGLAVAV